MSYFQNTIKPKDKKPKYKILQKPRLNRSNINSDQISQNSIKNYTLQEDGSKLYTIDTCTLTLTEYGKVFKQGKFNFEETENDESEQVKQQELNFKGEAIQSIEYGEMHILFLSRSGKLFSIGDNYYGQLGINNNRTPKIYEPQVIKLGDSPLICQSIYAYKHNSFAIDMSYHLYIWGKREYLLDEYKSNLYAPTMIYKELQIEKVIHSDNDDVIEIYKKADEEEVKEEEQQQEQVQQEQQEQEEQNDFNIINNEPQNEEQINLSQHSEDNNNIEQLYNGKYPYVKDTKDINDFITQMSSDKDLLENIRAYCSNPDYSFVKGDQMIKTWNKIEESINKAIAERPQNLTTKKVNVPKQKQIELFCFIFKTNIHHFYSHINFPRLKSLSPDYIELYNDKIKSFIQNKKKEYSKSSHQFYNTIHSMLIDNIKYKLLQNTSYHFAIHQYLCSIFDLNILIQEFSKKILPKLKEIESKSFFIERIYENILIIASYYARSIDNAPLNEFMQISTDEYQNMNNSNITNYNNIEHNKDVLMFQCLLDINRSIKDLWMYYTFHYKERFILDLKVKEIDNIYSIFNQIYDMKKKYMSGCLDGKDYHKKKGQELQKNLENMVDKELKSTYELISTQMIGYYSLSVLEGMKYSQILFNLNQPKTSLVSVNEDEEND